MNTPHKDACLLRAIADGKQMQTTSPFYHELWLDVNPRQLPTAHIPVALDGPYKRPPSRAARIFMAVLCLAIFSAIVLTFGPGGYFFNK
jgi:hypothetical protein